MTQLLLIKTDRGIKKTGDPIAIEDDDHIFDDNEKLRFTILKIPGTKEEIIAQSQSHKPETKRVFLNNEKYYEENTPEAENAEEMKILWKDGEIWKDLVTRPFKWGNWDGKKFVNTVLRHPENTITEISVETKSLFVMDNK